MPGPPACYDDGLGFVIGENTPTHDIHQDVSDIVIQLLTLLRKKHLQVRRERCVPKLLISPERL